VISSTKQEHLRQQKAKLAVNLLPGILSYELERIGTENTLRRVLQPIKKLLKMLLKKK
jgi:hypothetical protein